MKLKTLKDLKVDDKLIPSQAWMIMEEKLKAQAIKWVKNSIESKIILDEKNEDGVYPVIDNPNYRDNSMMIDFFNLTEDDFEKNGGKE